MESKQERAKAIGKRDLDQRMELIDHLASLEQVMQQLPTEIRAVLMPTLKLQLTLSFQEEEIDLARKKIVLTQQELAATRRELEATQEELEATKQKMKEELAEMRQKWVTSLRETTSVEKELASATSKLQAVLPTLSTALTTAKMWEKRKAAVIAAVKKEI